MADIFKKVEAIAERPIVGDSWKYIEVEKEHQPEKVKSTMTYQSMEKRLKNIDDSITSFTEQKAVLEAEMLQVKATAEA